MSNIVKICGAILIGLALTATGLWAGGADEEGSAAAAEKEMVLDPSTGKMVTAPEYGGTLTMASGINLKIFDTALAWPTYNVGGPVVEKLGMVDWAIDRDEYPIGARLYESSSRHQGNAG